MNNPKMMTVKEVAATGILSEYAIRLLIKTGRLPVLRVGNRALINFDRFREDLDNLRLTSKPEVDFSDDQSD